MADDAVLDDTIVEGLRRLGDQILIEIVQLWFDNLEPGLIAMRTASAADDRPALITAAHTLRGSAANVGAARLAAACAALETAARELAEGPELAALMDTVTIEAAAAQAALTRLVEQP